MQLDKAKSTGVQHFYAPILRHAVVIPIAGARNLVVIVGAIAGPAGLVGSEEAQKIIKEVARGLTLSVSQENENKNTENRP